MLGLFHTLLYSLKRMILILSNRILVKEKEDCACRSFVGRGRRANRPYCVLVLWLAVAVAVGLLTLLVCLLLTGHLFQEIVDQTKVSTTLIIPLVIYGDKWSVNVRKKLEDRLSSFGLVLVVVASATR